VDLSGRTVPPVPSATPGAAPSLNLDLRTGRASSRPVTPGTRGALNLMPPPPERRSKLAEDIEKAGKPDCRRAHADKGLLGVVPLAQAALSRDGDCRW
jgi:hypothetical protein